MTDAKLRTFFHQYNRQYFGGQLEEPRVIRFADMKSDGLTTTCSQFPTRVEIDRHLRRHASCVKITLLHEMVHLKIGRDCLKHHGIRFAAELVRLFNAGAYDGLL